MWREEKKSRFAAKGRMSRCLSQPSASPRIRIHTHTHTIPHQQAASCVPFRLQIKCRKCVKFLTSVNNGSRFSESGSRQGMMPLSGTYHTRRSQLSLQLRLTLLNQSGYCRFNTPPLTDRRRKANLPALLAFKRPEGVRGGGSARRQR